MARRAATSTSASRVLELGALRLAEAVEALPQCVDSLLGGDGLLDAAHGGVAAPHCGHEWQRVLPEVAIHGPNDDAPDARELDRLVSREALERSCAALGKAARASLDGCRSLLSSRVMTKPRSASLQVHDVALERVGGAGYELLAGLTPEVGVVPRSFVFVRSTTAKAPPRPDHRKEPASDDHLRPVSPTLILQVATGSTDTVVHDHLRGPGAPDESGAEHASPSSSRARWRS